MWVSGFLVGFDVGLIVALITGAIAFSVSERRTEKQKKPDAEKVEDGQIISVETNIYDEVEEHHNCTVQILTNSVTGEQSFGWWYEDEEGGDD